jgi:hypothetical protein
MIFPLAFLESKKKDRKTLQYIMRGTIAAVMFVMVGFAIYVGSALVSPHIPQMVNMAFLDYSFGEAVQKGWHSFIG